MGPCPLFVLRVSGRVSFVWLTHTGHTLRNIRWHQDGIHHVGSVPIEDPEAPKAPSHRSSRRLETSLYHTVRLYRPLLSPLGATLLCSTCAISLEATMQIQCALLVHLPHTTAFLKRAKCHLNHAAVELADGETGSVFKKPFCR